MCRRPCLSSPPRMRLRPETQKKRKNFRVMPQRRPESFWRSEADSNRCTRFCRPLPNHSAIRPEQPPEWNATATKKLSEPLPLEQTGAISLGRSVHRECKYTNNSAKSKSFAENRAYIFRIRTKGVPLPTKSFAAESTSVQAVPGISAKPNDCRRPLPQMAAAPADIRSPNKREKRFD